MNEYITFSIEMLLVSLVFFLAYRLISGHTTPTFRRYYLMAWLLFSIAFPLTSIEIPSASSVSVETFVSDSGSVFSSEPYVETPTSPDFQAEEKPAEIVREEKMTTAIDWGFWLIAGYIFIASVLLLRIALGYFQIWKLKKNSTPADFGGNRIFEVDDPTFKGASFFQWIFIGKSIEDHREMVVDHEFAHSRLYHSVDILLAHLYCAFLWFNPFAWVLKRYIAINTELETDAYLTQAKDGTDYANLLINLSRKTTGSVIMNHFSARHLKARIMAIKTMQIHQKWVSFFTAGIILVVFFFVSCSQADFSSEIEREARLKDIKQITTYFMSHQSDTQQKTGKVVAIANFLPNGDLDELVNKTSYPYDHQHETKREFWQQPIKGNLPYVMDGLHIGMSDNNLLYGNSWPSAHAQYLLDKAAREESRFPWREVFEVDNINRPTELKMVRIRDNSSSTFYFSTQMANVTTYYEYEGEKVTKISAANFYPEIEIEESQKELYENSKKSIPKDIIEKMEKSRANSGKKRLMSTYSYDGDLLTSVVRDRYEYKFHYDGDLLVRSEYYIENKLISSRVHYYEDGLPERTELFNIDNEPEYTITYEYEFWEE